MGKNENLITVKEDERLTRIIFNKFGYIRPSGRDGKSQKDTSENGGEGFGYEEWLNSQESFFGGWQYGFLQAAGDTKRKGKAAIRLKSGKTIKRLHFYHREFRETGYTNWYIGYIDDLRILSLQEREDVWKNFARKELLKKYRQDLKLVGIDVDKENDLLFNNGRIINVKFETKNLHFGVPKEIKHVFNEDEKEFDIDRVQFFKNARKIIFEGDESAPNILQNAVPPKGLTRVEIKNRMPRTASKRRWEGEFQNVVLHNQIQECLIDKLADKHGDGCVIGESSCVKGMGLAVDIRLEVKGEVTYYEVKTHGTAMACIRVAIGQLLEYRHYNQSIRASKLVIVSYHNISEEEEIYLQTLTQNLNVPIRYEQVSLKELEVGGYR